MLYSLPFLRIISLMRKMRSQESRTDYFRITAVRSLRLARSSFGRTYIVFTLTIAAFLICYRLRCNYAWHLILLHKVLPLISQMSAHSSRCAALFEGREPFRSVFERPLRFGIIMVSGRFASIRGALWMLACRKIQTLGRGRFLIV